MVPSAKTPSTTAVYHRPWSFQFPSTVSMTPKSRGGSWGRGDGLRRRFSVLVSAGGLGDVLRGDGASAGGLGGDRWLSSERVLSCAGAGGARPRPARPRRAARQRDVRGGGAAGAAAASSRAPRSRPSRAFFTIFDRLSRGIFCHWSLVNPSLTFLTSASVSSRIACSRAAASVGAVSFVGVVALSAIVL